MTHSVYTCHTSIPTKLQLKCIFGFNLFVIRLLMYAYVHVYMHVRTYVCIFWKIALDYGGIVFEYVFVVGLLFICIWMFIFIFDSVFGYCLHLNVNKMRVNGECTQWQPWKIFYFLNNQNNTNFFLLMFTHTRTYRYIFIYIVAYSCIKIRSCHHKKCKLCWNNFDFIRQKENKNKGKLFRIVQCSLHISHISNSLWQCLKKKFSLSNCPTLSNTLRCLW